MINFFETNITSDMFSEEENISTKKNKIIEIEQSQRVFFAALENSKLTQYLDKEVNPYLIKSYPKRSYCGAIFRVRKSLGLGYSELPVREPLSFPMKQIFNIIEKFYPVDKSERSGRSFSAFWSQNVVLSSGKGVENLFSISLPFATEANWIPYRPELPSYRMIRDLDKRKETYVALIFIRLGNMLFPVFRLYEAMQIEDRRNIYSSCAARMADYLGIAQQSRVSNAIDADFMTNWDEFNSARLAALKVL